MLQYVTYPKCSTCRNGKKWLEEQGIPFQERHIVDQPLTAAELKHIHEVSALPIKKFFNVSGMKYRELGLKDKLPTMTNEACYELLASDGMLVKRPLVFDGNKKVTVGFKGEMFENEWK